MTVSSSRTHELDINTVVRRALNLAGLMSPQQSTSDPSFGPNRLMALDFLDAICKTLNTTAPIERHTVRLTGAVTASSPTVTLSTSIRAMLGNAMYLATGDTYETPVELVDIAAYQSRVDKTSEGRPTQGYFAMQPTPTITLWPVPDTSGTLTVIAHLLCADVTNASETLDYERGWQAFFMWELASYLADSAGLDDKAMRCHMRAVEILGPLQDAGMSNSVQTMRVCHPTPWSR